MAWLLWLLVNWPPALEAWRAEIERRDSSRVVLVRVPTDAERNEITLPEDIEGRNALRRFFLDEGFLAQFAASHALSVHTIGLEGRYHFILLNLAREAEWKDGEEGLLAHELGHAWLDARGFRSLPYRPGPRACAAIHAGDMVQHVLIRAEARRRGVPADSYWIRNLEKALDALGADTADAGPCQRLSRLALWVDVRLGLSPAQWTGYDRFEAAFHERFPDLEPSVEEISARLRSVNLDDPEAFREAADTTLNTLNALLDAAP